ncbi:chromodomain-helicase-DNA-binding protein 7 [Hippoglossus stenolepis]|uniref:chromodomain-helicase-DNA-binding protein 7 n=1 Tax=Hippoglossus stenolepis TaxID=195615 RepID=UPI001FAEDBE9|nr:chromodomain-helicase-DNA-binding protein 7 [Hippoglossus stenolepis]XP_035026246.2 chromodomain-helicase-DNA-binding protein 7 [Hippoglossus stenolepis]
MADPGMLSLFGDDAGLFSDGLDGLGGCFPQQPAPGQSNPLAQQTNPSLNHEHQGNRGYHQGMIHAAGSGPGQPKLGQIYDHGPYTGYDQSGAPGGRMMAQNGPSQGTPNVNVAMNGMASHYHNNPANSSNPHHGYPGEAGAGGGGSGVWGQQPQQQSRSAYQQPPTQPGGGPNQMAGYQMSQGNYGGMQGPPTPNAARMNQHYPPQSMAPAPAQDPSHYMGHVGMGGAQMRHPQPQPTPQVYPNMGHTPQYPHSPSRQPAHTHQHQQGMGGFGGGQYPGYQAQYGAIGPGMGQSANTTVSTNTGQALGPGQLGQRFNHGSGPAAGQQGQRYPPAPPHQPQPLQTHSAPMQQQTGQQGQPMHPINHTQHPQNAPQSQNQPQSHIAPPAQGSYPSPASMSPMRVLGAPTPPPQQGRPPSAGLAGPPEVAGYTALQSPPNAMPHPQRTPQNPLSAPQHQQPHNMPPNAGQIYPSMGPQRGQQMGPNRPQLQQQQGPHEAPVSQSGDQRILQAQQQASRGGQPLQSASLGFQGAPVSQHGAPASNQGLAPPTQNAQTQHTHLPPHHLQSTPPQSSQGSNPWASTSTAPHPLSSPPLTPQKVPHVQHSPTDPSGDASMMVTERPTVCAGVPSQPISTEQPNNQETKPKKKKKKKAKVVDEEDEGEKKAGRGSAEVDLMSEFTRSGSEAGEQVTGTGIVEGSSPTVEEKKKRKKKPKEKAEVKEPKEPKTQKTPKMPKTPKDPKEKKAKSSMPKTKPPKKNSSKKVESEVGPGTAKKDSKRKRESSVSDDVEVKSPPPSPPEDDDDDGVQKRRSSRQVKRKRYTEDLEFRISEDDVSGDDSQTPKSPSSSQQQEMIEAEGPIVEKIMVLRLSKKQLEEGEEVEVEEFYVKFKGFSYLHCRWADLQELEKDKRVHQKIKRFRAKQLLNTFITEMDDEPFNPDYVEVDRVLDISESTDENGETVTLYLVKWCSLPYEDSTWELKADIDQSKIEEYERIAARTPNLKRVERPPAADWKKFEGSKAYRNSNSLREYQLEGLNWLTFNWYNLRNCILADEMGLGKTIQSITFLYEIFLKGIEGPYLVIAPLSTIPNWEREFRTWTELNAVVYHGSQASRKTIQAYEMYHRDAQGKIIKGVYRFNAIITTFEMILADCPELRSIPWRCVVIDEAHRLKNRNCKLLEGLKMMDMEHKVLLTGTPLQNTVEELFSLLNFLEPERFPSETTFMNEFGDLKTEEQVLKLQAILKPMMLRRLKEDVEKNLAPKEETIIEVELTNIQKKYYRAILERNFTFLSKGGVGGGGSGGGGANVPNLLNTMMELRKCCNHPYLINGAEEKIIEEFRDSNGGRTDLPDMALQAMVQAAGKLVLIDKLLPKLKAGGHRVLVFSQMVRCLDILEDYLIQKRYPYERIDGRVRGNLRQAAIDRFSRPDSDRFVFLLCTRAGGLGINLTAADTCIIFDSDWNPQNDLQAQARCHRIGQSKAVKIYRLITRNSYEREMFDKASLKLGLDKAVLQSMSGRENANSGVQQLSKKEVEDLLRKGAYGALMDEEDEGSKFCEEDIDQILQRRTHTITIESEGKGSTFAKASFVAAGNRTDISLEDPDFWQKWAKKAELDMDAMNGRNTLVIDTPRVRKQTRHFSSAKEDEMLEFSELESDEDEPSKPSTKPRRPQDKAHGYPRSECFRVEKNLLVYGWGRWSEILAHGRFKRPLKEADVETICRALLAYCLLHYRGDENIKSFIWDLITPSEDGTTKTLTNHSGLSTPVPRGRKGKKGKPQAPAPQTPRADWLASCNPDHLLQEDSYKRHLKHHCNKVLLRVRMLYYLRQEVIGDQAERILEGADTSELDIWIPQPFHAEVPADWWDSEADKSLLLGVFKHGYEKYNSMRADPTLCFLERVGMPDAKAIAAEQRGADMMTDGVEGEDEDPEYKPMRMPFKDEMDDFTNSPLDDKDDTVEGETEVAKSSENGTTVGGASGSNERLYWPAASALTARLRRLITAYQRSNRREQLRQEALNRPDGRRRRRRDFLPSIPMVTEAGGGATYIQDGATVFLTEGTPYLAKGSAYFAKGGQLMAESSPVMAAGSLMADGAMYYKERRQRWTRREEADFYRVVSTFGVVFDTQHQKFDWSQFRAFARLDKKTDESLEKYYYSFIAMCKRVCRMQVKTETELPDPTLIIDPITEERASRTLYRIELLRRIREQVLPHTLLSERLKLCQPSQDLPEWWECGRHDRDLLLGASKHGVSRTDYHILNDPTLDFLEAHQRFNGQRGAGIGVGTQGEMTKAGMGAAESTSVLLLTPAELASAAAAAKIAVSAAEEVKTEEGQTEIAVKKETDGGDSNDIPCTKTETPDEQENEGEVEKGEDEAAASPSKEVKEEETQIKVEKEEEEVKEEQRGEEETKLAEEEAKDLIEEKKSLSPDSQGDQEEMTIELSEHPESSPKAQPGLKTEREEDREERENQESPKSLKLADTDKSPEEEEEERMDEDDKSEKSSQAEASAASEQKNFDEESIASLSTSARDETRDGFCPDDLPETSALHALHDRAYAFSFWPKDRLMINRMDNICEAVLKGKWPVNRRHIFDFPGNLLPGHGSAVTTAAVATATDSSLQRRSLAELTMAAIHTPYSGNEDKTLSPQVHEDALSLTLPRQRRRRRRKIEIEAERAAKRRNLMEMVAQLRESHAAAESQSQAIDLTKAMHHHHKASPSLAGFPSGLVTSSSLKAQMELLQQAPTSGQRANGSLEADLPIMRRRRGRRKNVEGLELLFMGNKRAGGDDADGAKVLAVEGVQPSARAHRSNTIPEQSPSARSLASGSLEEEEAPVSNKELGEWLRQHPTYTMDMAGFTPKNEELLLSQFSKPKQKRHRCRNPNKIDINTLTGEERVPVINRRNGRKMGGAMAPPMKELPRWLLENPEFSIAPDWTDIVKQSGFLPEAMFDRLLTGPVVREEGVRRRGRRPKSEIAKAAASAQAAAAAQAAQASLATVASSAGGINPLLLNSLFGGMDLSSLQSLQSLQLAAGLMAFPQPTDPKQAAASAAAASMLPLMLPGMGGLPNMAAALPNIFSLGSLFGGNLATAAASNAAMAAAVSGITNGTMGGEGGDIGEMVTTKRRREAEEKEGESGEEEEEDEEEADGNRVKKAQRKMEKEKMNNATAEASINGDAAALLAAAGMSANSLAFNPFLLSTMAPGLLYPSMFLPPGLGGLTLPGFPTASTLAELQSAMAGMLGGNAISTNPPRVVGEEKKVLKASAEEEEEEDDDDEDYDEKEEEGGGESDLAEEKDEDARGEADDSVLEDGGMGGEEEEAAASPQKDTSD